MRAVHAAPVVRMQVYLAIYRIFGGENVLVMKLYVGRNDGHGILVPASR